jgi:hypothetical protein
MAFRKWSGTVSCGGVDQLSDVSEGRHYTSACALDGEPRPIEFGALLVRRIESATILLAKAIRILWHASPYHPWTEENDATEGY